MSLPVVIVLAAGRSARFRAAAQGQHKLEATLGERTVLQTVLDTVAASGLPWHLVDAAQMADRPQAGMGDSLARGVAATADAPGWLILPADLPLVQTATLRRVAQALQQHPVVVPEFQGQRGHPVGFAAVCGAALQALHGDVGAQSVLAAHAPVHRIAVDDEGCVLDVDTPEALQVARALWQQRRAAARVLNAR